jgi:hypothetical protein
MRLVVTADLHFNHPVSRPLAEDVIGQINRTGGDVLLVVGDTGVFDGDVIERCLSLFDWPGEKLFVAGNHELWSNRVDHTGMYDVDLPARVRAMDWRWLETDPFRVGDVAVVGTVGWYDYSFAQPGLEIPKRFYAAKVSPGAAARLGGYQSLFESRDDISERAMGVVARWNDGKFVKTGMTDEAFLDQCVSRLRAACEANADARAIVAGVHHLPFGELLPPPKSSQWDFAKAYLGSERLGQTLLEFPNVTHVYCGHSHLPGEATVGHVRAINVGSGYRHKFFHTLDV